MRAPASHLREPATVSPQFDRRAAFSSFSEVTSSPSFFLSARRLRRARVWLPFQGFDDLVDGSSFGSTQH